MAYEYGFSNYDPLSSRSVYNNNKPKLTLGNIGLNRQSPPTNNSVYGFLRYDPNTAGSIGLSTQSSPIGNSISDFMRKWDIAPNNNNLDTRLDLGNTDSGTRFGFAKDFAKKWGVELDDNSSGTGTETGTGTGAGDGTGFGLNLETFDSIAKGLEALSGLAGAYLGYKNYGLAKKQFGFEKDAFNRNIANQAKVINNSIAGGANVAGLLNASPGMSDAERLAIREKALKEAESRYVDGSPIR